MLGMQSTSSGPKKRASQRSRRVAWSPTSAMLCGPRLELPSAAICKTTPSARFATRGRILLSIVSLSARLLLIREGS